MEKLFSVKNKLSGRNGMGGIFMFATDTEASVKLCEEIKKSNTLFLEENELYRIGEYDPETQIITPCNPELIPWDYRRIKERKMEDKTPEEVRTDLASM